MGFTSYVSDIHGDASYLDAIKTISNHLSDKYKIDSSIVNSGDICYKGEDFKKLDDVLEDYNGKSYWIPGNHDLEHSENWKDMKNSENAEWKKIEINGKKHYFARHASANGFFGHPEEDEYKSLEEKFDEVKENIKDTDYLIIHEGIKEFSYNGSHKKHKDGTYHKGLAELIEEYKPSIVCGHNHHSKMKENKDGSRWIQTCAQPDRNGEDKYSFYIRVNKDGKDTFYEISNTELRKWAKEINPKGNYEKTIDNLVDKEQQMIQQAANEFIMKNQEDFNNYIAKESPEMIKLIRDLHEGKIKEEEKEKVRDVLNHNQIVLMNNYINNNQEDFSKYMQSKFEIANEDDEIEDKNVEEKIAA